MDRRDYMDTGQKQLWHSYNLRARSPICPQALVGKGGRTSFPLHTSPQDRGVMRPALPCSQLGTDSYTLVLTGLALLCCPGEGYSVFLGDCFNNDKS